MGAPAGWRVIGFHSRTVLASAVASSLPPGLNATTSAAPRGAVAAGSGAPAGRWVSGFHSRTVPSPSTVASSLPSGLNATSIMPTWEPATRRGAPTGRRVTGSHNRTVPEPAVASSLPSGLNAQPDTPRAPEPVRRAALSWVTGSHSLPAATSLPLGLNDTPISRPWVWRGAPAGWRVTGSHNRTVPEPAVASSLPLGL